MENNKLGSIRFYSWINQYIRLKYESWILLKCSEIYDNYLDNENRLLLEEKIAEINNQLEGCYLIPNYNTRRDLSFELYYGKPFSKQ